jgi:hypothetical protein
MKFIINTLQRFYSSQSIKLSPLGRWKLVKNTEKQYERQDRSNSDHCGVCHYNEIKNSTTKNKLY